MSDIFTVAFFGHRRVENMLKTEVMLEAEIKKAIDEHEYVNSLL